MFDYFSNKREHSARVAAFQEAAAISTWTLISMLEVNEQFFQLHPEECEKANAYLQGSLNAAEQGNHRWANNHCMAYLRKTLHERPELISVHPSLVEALARMQK